MTPSERLKEIEKDFLDQKYDCPTSVHILKVEDFEWLIARVHKLTEALEKACYRHHMDCDKQCANYCPVEISRKALEE